MPDNYLLDSPIMSRMAYKDLLRKRLLYLRKRKNWSQFELATHSGVSRDTISQIERFDGVQSPTIYTCYLLAEALEVTLPEFLNFAEFEGLTPD